MYDEIQNGIIYLSVGKIMSLTHVFHELQWSQKGLGHLSPLKCLNVFEFDIICHSSLYLVKIIIIRWNF